LTTQASPKKNRKPSGFLLGKVSRIMILSPLLLLVPQAVPLEALLAKCYCKPDSPL